MLGFLQEITKNSPVSMYLKNLVLQDVKEKKGKARRTFENQEFWEQTPKFTFTTPLGNVKSVLLPGSET